MSAQFRWVGQATVGRSKGNSPAIELNPGQLYNVKDFGVDVVAEWMATGFAEPANPNATNTVLTGINGTKKKE